MNELDFSFGAAPWEEFLDTVEDSVSAAQLLAVLEGESESEFEEALQILEDRGIAQVSMNMVNYEDTPLYLAYEMINSLAERYGTRVIESEIVGLTPAKALIDCAEFYLKAKDFDCKKQVMEYHLIDMNH